MPLEKNKRTERRPRAFGPTLIRARTRAGLSQRQLAALAGVQSGHIAAIEAGWILWPSQRFVARIAGPLGLDVSDLGEAS